MTGPGASDGDAAGAQANVAGVRLVPGGRTVPCDAGAFALRPGEIVVVSDDQRGLELLATVSVAPVPRPERPRLRVLRLAQPADRERASADRRRTQEVLDFARARARDLALPMKLFRAELAPAGERAVLYFSAEQRVDFRALVRDLAAFVRCRIELRQVGVRDEAKAVGGIGSCGRELCCTTFLPQFAPVTIKTAKNQNLALNPARVSGQCGRLKCCLVYEEAHYVEAALALPRLGKRVETPAGVGRVADLDILAGRVRVSFPDRPPSVFTAAEVRPASASRSPGPDSTAS